MILIRNGLGLINPGPVALSTGGNGLLLRDKLKEQNPTYWTETRLQQTTVNDQMYALALLEAEGTITPSPAPVFPGGITNLKAWLRAQDITGVNEGGRVRTWRSRDSTGRLLTTASAAQSPKLTRNVLNGRSALKFEAGQSMVAAFAQVQPVTVFAVASIVVSGGDVVDGVTANTMVLQKNATHFRAFSGAFLDIVGSNTAFHIFCLVFNGAASVIRVDGGAGVVGAAGAGNPAGLTVGSAGGGANTALFGDIAEVVMCNGALSLADINAIGDYLAARYAIAWTPAA